ncbi:MAG: hypothetical protein ABF298_12980, partial [Alteriqipengyuania sp.]
MRHAAPGFLKPQHGSLGRNGLRRRVSGKLRAAPVKEIARNQLAAFSGLGNRCADCTVPGPAKGKVPGFAGQRAGSKHCLAFR